MDERPPHGSPSDDQRFLERLHELDRGLGAPDGRHRGTPPPRAPEAVRGRAHHPAGDLPDDDPVGFLTEAIFEGHETVAPPAGLPRARSTRLDLFPPSAVDGPRAPASIQPPSPSAPAAAGAAPIARVPVAPAAPPYQPFYGLDDAPFALSSDPRFFYPSASADHVLNALLEAVHAAEGLIVVTGESGIGKTTVCRTAARDLDRRTVQSLVVEPPQSIDELLQIVLVDFGVVSRRDLVRRTRIERSALTATLGSFVNTLAAVQANALIVVDEAHRLPQDDLRALADVAAALDSPRLQVVLAGEPALLAMVNAAGWRTRRGGAGLRLELHPLAADEVAGYVNHRLHAVDRAARVEFSPAACARLHQVSRGVPREINRLCDRALVLGAALSASTIDRALVDRAAGELNLAIPPEASPRTFERRAVTALVLIALMFAGAAAAAWVFRDAATRALSRWLRPAAISALPADNVPAPPVV